MLVLYKTLEAYLLVLASSTQLPLLEGFSYPRRLHLYKSQCQLLLIFHCIDIACCLLSLSMARRRDSLSSKLHQLVWVLKNLKSIVELKVLPVREDQPLVLDLISDLAVTGFSNSTST